MTATETDITEVCRKLAALTHQGEPDPFTGAPFDISEMDAVHTLNALIMEARSALGIVHHCKGCGDETPNYALPEGQAGFCWDCAQIDAEL
jgi:hypothetical protein